MLKAKLEIKKTWYKDITAGFSVALVALPLALALAIASGAPPISGIISAVVGSIVFSLLGGSYITITGPGNSLVVVILSAVTILGKGNLTEGYHYTLAAIVISGFILLLLGILKLERIGDFFPSTALQGLLAAIGLIIIAKQSHIMLGNLNVQAENNLLLLCKIPNSFLNAFVYKNTPQYVAEIGIASLLFIILYSKIKIKLLHYLPAPMWVVLLAIGIEYYFEIFSSSSNQEIKKYLIQLPDKLTGSFVFPDFSMIKDKIFWETVLSITFISAVESLLSIKAIDKLDPLKRRSNLNKSLRSLGIGTSLSGFLGGLPVVAVIARSSVNITYGGISRMSNFFHAFFLIIFILLFNEHLSKISTASLAAILVFVGYKLITPQLIRNIYKIGIEQLLIFFVTIFATLYTNLITGFIIGIATTLLIQIIFIPNKLSFFINLFKPNTIAFEEDNGVIYVGIKYFCNFLNFYKLKKQLDSLPLKKHIIVDFSLTDFVDHSVMEYISQYEKYYKKIGGHFDIIGLDSHNAISSHPLASRGMLKIVKKIRKVNILTKRQMELKNIAKSMSFNYRSRPLYNFPYLSNFKYFRTKQVDNVYNVLSKKEKNSEIFVFDIHYHIGEMIARETMHSTMIIIKISKRLPSFILDKENIFDKILDFNLYKKIDFDEYPDFSKKYLVRSKNIKGVKKLFNKEMINCLENNYFYHIESNGRYLLIFKKERLLTIKELKLMINFSNNIFEIISSSLPYLKNK